jgi:hypothetical protein
MKGRWVILLKSHTDNREVIDIIIGKEESKINS